MNLQQLIEIRRNGATYRQLATNSGGRVTGASFQNLATKAIVNFPATETIRGLAIALDTPINAIIQAISETVGITDTDSEEQDLIEYWKNHAQHWKQKANHSQQKTDQLQHHFNQLQPISRERPWLKVGTQHNIDHIRQQAGEQPNPLRGSTPYRQETT